MQQKYSYVHLLALNNFLCYSNNFYCHIRRLKKGSLKRRGIPVHFGEMLFNGVKTASVHLSLVGVADRASAGTVTGKQARNLKRHL